MSPLRLIVLALAALLALAATEQAAPLGTTPTATVAAAELPPEARATLALIKQGGPFPFHRDGAVFANREQLLPPRPRGYYREYTVPTPGAAGRGARRIVAGGGEYYYSADHYQSFRRIRE